MDPLHTDGMSDVHAPPRAFPRHPSYPFRDGDRFASVAEFERLREEIVDGTKAELIRGVVHMTPPASDEHGRPHVHLSGWLCLYEAATPGVLTSIDQIAHPEEEEATSVGPDITMIVDPACGGAVRRVKGAWDGRLDLVVEVARTSVRVDLGLKREVYEASGAREYLVWVVPDARVVWWRREGEAYVELAPGADGLLRSTVFPGLWLDPSALATKDLPRLLAALQRGLATPEHAAFAERLRAARS